MPDAVGGDPAHGWGLGVSASSNNGEVTSRLRYDGARGRIGWRLSGVGRFASALHTPDGELENTGYGAFSGEAAFTVRGSASRFSLRFSHYGGEFKLLEANGPPQGVPEGQEEGPERKLQDQRLQAEYFRLAGPWAVSLGAQYQRHSLIEVSDDFEGGVPGQETTAFDLLLNSLTGRATASRDIGHGLSATLAASGLLESNDTRGPIHLVPDASIGSGAASVLLEDHLGRIAVSAGARLDLRHLSADPNSSLELTAQSRDYTAGSGTLGAVFQAGAGVSVRANAGLAWRAPNLFELFANGPHLGELRYERGNPDLGSEHGVTLDLGLRLNRSRVRGDAGVYLHRINDYIHITPTSESVGPLRVYQHVAGDAELLGAEGELEFDPAAGLTIHASADAVRATDQGTDEPLPLTPPLRGTMGIEVHGDWGRLHGARAGAELVLVDRARRTADLDVATAGYGLVNLDAGLVGRLAGHQVSVDLGVRNLLDQRYRDFLSRYKEFALNPGRDITLRLDWVL